MVLSVEEAGQILGCGRRKVFELLRDGILERAPRYGRALRIYRASVEAALRPPEPRKRRKRAVSFHAVQISDVADLLL